MRDPSAPDLAAILDLHPDVICRFLPDGRLTYVNRAYCDALGVQRDEILGRAWTPIIHPDDLPHVRRRAARLSLEAPEIVFEGRVLLADGQPRCTQWIHTGVFDAQGQLIQVQAVGRDIHSRKRVEAQAARGAERLQLLARASHILVSSLDTETMLQRVAHLTVPTLNDWCTVALFDERTGQLYRSAIAHVDPQQEQELARRDSNFDLGAPGFRALVDLVLAGGHALLPEITDEILATHVYDPETQERLRSHRVRSIMVVPLIARGHTLGCMILLTCRAWSDRAYTADDLGLALELGRHAALAIDNARLFEAMQELDRRKDTFLATLAHEIRNPLAAVRNALEVLRRRGDDPVARQRALDIANRQVRHQVRMVDDLLDVSRLSRGVVTLRIQRVALDRLIREALEIQRPSAERAGHTLRLGPLPAVSLDADPARIQQILSNLVDNAVKHTDPGGIIDVWMDAPTEGVRIHIRDNGRGIPPDLRPSIFEPFIQGERGHTAPQSGIGIGLTITRELVHLHRGSVEIRDGLGGRGTEVVITLPTSPAQAEEASPRAGRLRILVVDDNVDGADMLAALLRSDDQEVHVTYDGESAVEAQRAEPFDLALIDLGMPHVDGYAVARRIRAYPGGERVRLVALSGYTQKRDVDLALEAGFDRYQPKPIEPARIEELLAWARQAPEA